MKKDETGRIPRVTGGYVERRKKKDWVAQAVPIFSMAGWFFALLTLVFLDRAQPQKADFFSRLFSAPIRSQWNIASLRTALIVLLVTFALCIVGFIFNMRRHRRKSDRYNLPLIILGLITLAGIALFAVRFAALL